VTIERRLDVAIAPTWGSLTAYEQVKNRRGINQNFVPEKYRKNKKMGSLEYKSSTRNALLSSGRR